MREEKADQATDQTPHTLTTDPEQPRSRRASQRNISRSRSRSRRAPVTDKGQASSTDDLARLALPSPGLAEATRIAPERYASFLPSPKSEYSSFGDLPTPRIAVDGTATSRPQSPETLIPTTDTLSTRPTRGGIAYPFSLKVEGGDRNVNASTATLQSVNVEDGEGIANVVGSEKDKKVERPVVERFETAPEVQR